MFSRSTSHASRRVQTSYVTVEPKRRRQDASPQSSGAGTAGPSTQHHGPATTAAASKEADSSQGRPSAARELRRARIVITVKRTESYKQWLEDNPLQAVIAGDDDEEDEAVAAVTEQER